MTIALDGVCRPLGSRRLIQGRLRLEIAHPKTQSTVLEAVAQDREQSLRLAGGVERCAELPHRVHLIGVFKTRPFLGLGALDKVDQGIHIEPLFGVIGVCTLGISARRGEKEGFYIRFKTLFGGDHSFIPFCTPKNYFPYERSCSFNNCTTSLCIVSYFSGASKKITRAKT